jgi:hypothetical protein
MHNGSNVLVHLIPAPVVARVATLAALVRPGVEAWLRWCARAWTRRRGRTELAELVVAIDGLPGQALHGDAHPWNLLVTPDSGTWRALANSKTVNGCAGLTAYPSSPPAAEIELLLRLRRLFTACWPAFLGWARRVHGLGTTTY